GNVRELQNVIERAVVLADGPVLELDPHLLPRAGGPAGPGRAAEPGPALAAGLAVSGSGTDRSDASGPPAAPGAAASPAEPATLEEVERRHIRATLERTGWVVEGPRGAARVLGLHPNTLRSRMGRLGIRRPAHNPP
ncbi:MAG TPA: helix-turn-helix domain-containing protein, partial [Methylomirabilota bacterium]|nr:helix-turn-helix domain-containing protein [Methylomirabilota bacterium]